MCFNNKIWENSEIRTFALPKSGGGGGHKPTCAPPTFESGGGGGLVPPAPLLLRPCNVYYM